MIPKGKTFLTYIYITMTDIKVIYNSLVRDLRIDNPEFFDQEIITLFLFSIKYENKYKVKHIYQFAKDYLLSWFPKLTLLESIVVTHISENNFKPN